MLGSVSMRLIQVLINNSKFTANEFSKVAAYVSQDDLLFGTLTVKGKPFCYLRNFLIPCKVEAMGVRRGSHRREMQKDNEDDEPY